MRKSLVGAVLAGAMTLSMGGTAFGGEITGGPNPKPTPIATYQAKSICSFSGQNDDPNHPDPFEAGRVQSFGAVLKVAKGMFGDGKGASSLTGLIRAEGPGTACRGNAVHE